MSSCRTLVLALLAFAAAGCRVHYESIRIGGDWDPQEFFELRVGEDGRGEVLARFGPPDEVLYPLDEEVFFYRTGGHRGSDLRLLIPDPILNRGRSGLELFSPGRTEPTEFQNDPLPVRILHRINGFFFGFFNPISTDEGVGLYGRRIRWNVVRLVFDRDTHLIESVEILETIDEMELKELINEAILIDEDEVEREEDP